jgi:hypothetical protein
MIDLTRRAGPFSQLYDRALSAGCAARPQPRGASV